MKKVRLQRFEIASCCFVLALLASSLFMSSGRASSAAKAAGLRCVAVTHSYPAATLLDAGADLTAADLISLDDDLLDGTVP